EGKQMNHWDAFAVPPMRYEAQHGDRVVRCFTSRPEGLYAMFVAALLRSPQGEALVCEGRRWTYADCDVAVGSLAARLAAHGVQHGERAILWIGNRPEFVIALLALQRIGAIAVPVGIREQRPGLAYIAQQCGAVAILVDAELVERLPDPAEAPQLRLRLTVDETPDGVSMRGLLLDGDGWDRGTAPPPVVCDEHETAVILYTSGTTGNPKGAMLTQSNIVHSALHYQACMRLEASDRSALAVPASHVTGLIAVIAAMLQVGGTTVIVPAFKAESFIALLAAERVSHTLMVPAMYQLCLLHPSFAHADLNAWRTGGYGGAPMPVATIDALTTRLPQLTLINAYGATETTSPATMIPAGLTREHADSVGVALPATDIRVMDENGRELPPGETGELWVGGPMVVPGYWGNPQATAASFTAGYWHSGDLGSVDAAGFVRLFDRKKDMLNRGGYKVYSVEVENVLMAWPGMVEAAVLGRPCPVLGERVHAVLHAGPECSRDTTALQAFCAARLADYKVPETFGWSDQPLPRNANGKVMKRVLKQALQDTPAPAAAR
ncbi:MAG: class I adenylate-forming enzyme family protein, partial [Burkholderiaceae bacterium]